MRARKRDISNGVKIIVADNYQDLSRLAAKRVIKEILRRPAAVLGLPTGGTPLGLYKNLVKAGRDKKASFKRVRTFNLDEYVGLGEKDRASYRRYMKHKLFDFIDLKAENVFIPDGQAQNLKQECARYESLIKKQGGIDLLVLGIGLDGHIGFNEPGSPFNSRTRVVKLRESTRRANARYFSGLEQVPRQAITMGLGTIMKARQIMLLASGGKKAEILRRALTGPVSKTVPASILQKHKNLTVILEKGAAGQLALITHNS